MFAHADAILLVKTRTWIVWLLQKSDNIAKKNLQVLYNSNDSGVLVDPYSVEDEKWKDDVSLWPPVEFGEIYTYLIDTPGQFTITATKIAQNINITSQVKMISIEKCITSLILPTEKVGLSHNLLFAVFFCTTGVQVKSS